MQHEDNKKKPAMEVRNLSFSYGKNRVLKDTSFKIEEGKITTILGANGCGKSTLFNLMTKNLYPGRGNIFLYGKNIQNLTLKEFARKVSIVHQYNTSADDITVERLVSFGRTPHMKLMQGRSEEEIDRRVREAGIKNFGAAGEPIAQALLSLLAEVNAPESQAARPAARVSGKEE